LSYYFSFSAYPLLAVLFMGVTAIMLIFNNTDLAKRNRCSPLTNFKMNMQLFLGNVTFALAVWMAVCTLNLLLYSRSAAGSGVVFLCLNALVFTVVCLSIGFLAGKYVKNGVVQSALANVISLGLSFISGVFVEQALLGSTVLKIASFTPAYWYVKATGSIRDLSEYSFASMTPIFTDMLIQLGFAAAFVTISLVASKQNRTSRA
jgi:ABC-2 type transport system permease protein